MITVQDLPFTTAVVVEVVSNPTEKEDQVVKVVAEMVAELVMQPQMEQLTLVVEAVVLVVSINILLKVVLVDLVSSLLDIQHLNLIPQ